MISGSARKLGDIAFDDRFVRLLPGEAVDEHASLGRSRAVTEACHSPAAPEPVPNPQLIALVPEVAALLDLSTEPDDTLVAVLGGNKVLPGMRPYAACYGGHQFGSWAGQLGDGRAMTLGEVVNARGERWELQLKGAGPTAYSRRADGRAVLRSSLRELVCSEAMFHLGVPTTRALSLVATGAEVMRDMLYDGHPAAEPGAIVCRVAPSFLRFGNYEIHTARGDRATLQKLVDFTLRGFFPTIDPADPQAVVSMFREISRLTVDMVVHWMRVGFVHGVMNTDNMSILGLTIDYGPYGWVDVMDPGWTPNTTDAGTRRYRFGNQPRIAHWNLVQLANALLPLVGDPAPFESSLESTAAQLGEKQRSMFMSKLGLTERSESWDEDDQLLNALFDALTERETDMTIVFRRLADVPLADGVGDEERLAAVEPALYAASGPSALARWLVKYVERARIEGLDGESRRQRMNAVNPLYVPRNYLLQEVIDRSTAGDHAGLHELMDVLRRPYTEQPGRERFAEKRPEWARHKVGCSMLSCSS